MIWGWKGTRDSAESLVAFWSCSDNLLFVVIEYVMASMLQLDTIRAEAKAMSTIT